MTSGGNEDAYAWRVRAQGASWIVEHGVSSRAWRRVGAFTLPAGATLEPDPDGVYQ
ncbi:MAG: hypothetical protein V9G19_27685 [Tetrasphaera sp.]